MTGYHTEDTMSEIDIIEPWRRPVKFTEQDAIHLLYSKSTGLNESLLRSHNILRHVVTLLERGDVPSDMLLSLIHTMQRPPAEVESYPAMRSDLTDLEYIVLESRIKSEIALFKAQKASGAVNKEIEQMLERVKDD